MPVSLPSMVPDSNDIVYFLFLQRKGILWITYERVVYFSFLNLAVAVMGRDTGGRF